ncbi:unnamed protein product [Pleuronectes platessa]|uniref:Uncharacterized protein n=1 Tax=Pleuronectes platessa TaxID=8262 RepID=A0A9N7UM94_PLEPL|nr:unnamed protein product [Pleuronectes platessa]
MSGEKDCGTSNTSNSLVKIGTADCQRWTDGGKKGSEKLLLSNNFLTLTNLHYQPHIRADCSGSLPKLINKPRDSGFRQLRSHLQPETGEELKPEYGTDSHERLRYVRLFATHSFGMRARKEKEEEGFIHYSSIHSSIQNSIHYKY